MNKTMWKIWALIVISFIAGIYFYPQLPDQIASHWNTQGQVDGYMSKFWGTFLLPIVLVGMVILFWIIPKIDPLKHNIEKFRRYFDGFILVIVLFLMYIYGLSLAWNLGKMVDITRMILPAIGFVIFYAGVLMEHAKRNWFIGIRTPWTMSSEEVWAKTHRIGAKLFKVSGIIALLGVFAADYAIYLTIVPIAASALYTLVYSYVEYQKLKSR